jgi:hypothetical protein
VDGRPFTFISQGPDKWDRTTYTVLPTSGSPIIFLLPPPIPQSLLNPDCIPIEVVHLAPAMTGPWFQRQLASLPVVLRCSLGSSSLDFLVTDRFIIAFRKQGKFSSGGRLGTTGILDLAVVLTLLDFSGSFFGCSIVGERKCFDQTSEILFIVFFWYLVSG